jgi:hypothetical protein
MNLLEETIRRMEKYLEWEANTCHFFYPVEKDENISDKNLKSAFDTFISSNYENAKFEKIEDLALAFKNLSYEEKLSYFSSDSIYVIDCSNLDKSNHSTFQSLHDCGKLNKLAFIYYIPNEKMWDQVIMTDQYQFRTFSIENINKELYTLHQYQELKEEVNASSTQNIVTKKPKV